MLSRRSAPTMRTILHKRLFLATELGGGMGCGGRVWAGRVGARGGWARKESSMAGINVMSGSAPFDSLVSANIG